MNAQAITPAQDPVRELLDLIAVHKFYVKVLEASLGFAVPLPHETENIDAANKGNAQHSIRTLRRWLALLDMAVGPLVVRDAIKEGLKQETAEALMRYFVEKASRIGDDRDKTDVVA